LKKNQLNIKLKKEMFNFNRKRTRTVSLWMFGLCGFSTIATVIELVIFNLDACTFNGYDSGYDLYRGQDYYRERCPYMANLIRTGLWSLVFSWTSAILAFCASKPNSRKCIMVAHLVMVGNMVNI